MNTRARLMPRRGMNSVDRFKVNVKVSSTPARQGAKPWYNEGRASSGQGCTAGKLARPNNCTAVPVSCCTMLAPPILLLGLLRPRWATNHFNLCYVLSVHGLLRRCLAYAFEVKPSELECHWPHQCRWACTLRWAAAIATRATAATATRTARPTRRTAREAAQAAATTQLQRRRHVVEIKVAIALGPVANEYHWWQL